MSSFSPTKANRQRLLKQVENIEITDERDVKKFANIVANVRVRLAKMNDPELKFVKSMADIMYRSWIASILNVKNSHRRSPNSAKSLLFHSKSPSTDRRVFYFQLVYLAFILLTLFYIETWVTGFKRVDLQETKIQDMSDVFKIEAWIALFQQFYYNQYIRNILTAVTTHDFGPEKPNQYLLTISGLRLLQGSFGTFYLKTQSFISARQVKNVAIDALVVLSQICDRYLPSSLSRIVNVPIKFFIEDEKDSMETLIKHLQAIENFRQRNPMKYKQLMYTMTTPRSKSASPLKLKNSSSK